MHHNRFMLGDVASDVAAPTDLSAGDSYGLTDVFGTALDDLTQIKTSQAQAAVASQQAQLASVNAKSTQTLLIGAALLFGLIMLAKR